jgi:hypothetical protein
VKLSIEQMRKELAQKPMSAKGRAAAGQLAANMIKKQPQVKASEALGQLMEKGYKKTTTTQADRTRVGGGNIGGAAFPAISAADPAYEGKVWGVQDPGTAARLTNLTDPETAWTTMLGSADQLKTNPIVFDKLRRAFLAAKKEGRMTPELADKFNHNLRITFGEGADIHDPKIFDAADTFKKRAALADLMMGQGLPPPKGGVPMGGELRGGAIFHPTEILKEETERSLMHPKYGGKSPTYSLGPRLFSLSGTHEQRPDLHPGFPTLLHGEDLGYNMGPVPTEVYLPDWHKRFKQMMKNTSRKAPAGYYDLALGIEGEGLPSQKLHDDYIRHLIREGYAEGGEVEHYADGGSVEPDKDTMLASLMLRKTPDSINIKDVGVNEAPDLPIKAFVSPNGGSSEGLPIGGVDFQPLTPGNQMMPQQPGNPPQPGIPSPQSMGTPPMGTPPGAPPQPGQPQSNILSLTPQGQAMQAMRPQAMPQRPGPTMPKMAEGGQPPVEEMRKAITNKIKISKTAPRTWAGTGFGDKGASYGIESHPHLMVIRESHGWTARDPNTKQKWFGEDKNELENELNKHFDSNKMKRGGSTHDIHMTERKL